MILSLLVIVLVGVIAFFHYTQGLFAATVSAFCAGVAAFMAFSFHETIPATWLAEPMGAYGYPVVLCILFAVVYALLRTVADNGLPGNVRYPAALDKVGAGVMGVIAGLFPAAIVSIAAQEMPVGPSFMMYSTYETEDGSVPVDRNLSRLFMVEQGDDAPVYDAMVATSFDGEEARETRQSLILPVDEWFLGMVQKLSDQGSLAGRQTLQNVYPDFKRTLFGERIGIQPTVSRTAVTLGDEEQVTVQGLYLISTSGENAQFDGGIPQVDGDLRFDRKSPPERLRPGPDQVILVLRAMFDSDARDQGIFHFSPGSVSLVVGGRQYHPVATLESAAIAVAARPDDYLLTPAGADLVFVLDRDVAFEGDTLADDAYLQVKRYTRIDLGDMPIASRIAFSDQTHLLRKVPIRRNIGQVAGNVTQINQSEAAFEALRSGSQAPADVLDDPDTDDIPEGQDQGTSSNPMDVIRQGAGERNQAIEGGGL